MNETDQIYSNKVRVRACGILIEDQKLLLIKHEGIGSKGYLWSPPGGGIQFNEEAEKCVIREFKEETHLDVHVNKFMFVNEFMDDRFHALELFFEVERISGELQLGIDPEMKKENQIISDVKWFTQEELQQLEPSSVHNFIHRTENIIFAKELTGFFKFVNNSTK